MMHESGKHTSIQNRINQTACSRQTSCVPQATYFSAGVPSHGESQMYSEQHVHPSSLSVVHHRHHITNENIPPINTEHTLHSAVQDTCSVAPPFFRFMVRLPFPCSLQRTLELLSYCLLVGIANAFRTSNKFYGHHSKHQLFSSLDSSKIDLQSDGIRFGRGDFHLSALIDEGDVVVYQTGSWLVDGVVVGEDDAAPRFALAKIDNVQVVWTHNCEHGVLRGIEVVIDPLDNTRVLVSEPLQDVEFGPEQLLARLPVAWEDEKSTVGIANVPLEAELWWSGV